LYSYISTATEQFQGHF